MATMDKVNLDELAGSIVGCFPRLELLEQRLSLGLYRLLAEGQPVPRATLAEQLAIPIDTADRILGSWPGVFSDAARRIVGYWGLSIPAAYAGSHRLMVDGRVLSAWCAWDTLFIPQLLGQAADVESTSPVGGETVRLRVKPDRVERVEPATAAMSILLPDAKEVTKDVISSFCHFVHFFPSHEAAEGWIAQHAGTFLLSIYEAHALARLKNEAQYSQVLGKATD